LKSVSETCYIHRRRTDQASPGLMVLSRVLAKDYAMTTHIIHLTAQIQRWLNQSVARHLAAQAERLEPATKH
jgi:hypothetical protein